MRALTAAICAACFATSAVTQDQFLKDEALQEEIAKSCADGCVTFSRQEAADFQDQLQALIERKQAEAFAAGVQHQKQACPSLI